MATIIRMPEIAANTTHARLEVWLVAEGQPVTTGQILAEIETEKAMVELVAESAGTLHRRLVPGGTDVNVGTPLAILTTAETTESEIAALLQTLDADAVTLDADAVTLAAPAPRQNQDGGSEALPDAKAPAPRLFSSPLARKRARERGVDLAEIDGHGPQGRITVRDVEAHVLAPTSPATVKSPTAIAFVDIPHTPMRRAIARRLIESKTTVPHYYLSASCRADALLDMRRQVNADETRHVSVTDLIIMAVAQAFLDVPEANVIWTDDAVRRFSTLDVAVAVSTDQGLVTPVLRDATALGLVELSGAVADLVDRARGGRLRQHEIEGGSFAITNLGMYGTESFSAIISPPHSGILAVGAARRAPVVDGGALVVGTVIEVTLSVDHRVIDGALSATWLAAFRRAVENPIPMLLRAG